MLEKHAFKIGLVLLAILGVLLFTMPLKAEPVTVMAVNFLSCDKPEEVEAFIAMDEAGQSLMETQAVVPGCTVIPQPMQVTIEPLSVHETAKARYAVVKITIAGMTQYSVFARVLKSGVDA